MSGSCQLAIDQLNKVLAATSLEEIWAHHVTYMDAFGFDRIIYGLTRMKSRHGSQGHYGNPDDVMILSNHGKCYTSGFIDTGLYLSSPMLRWADQNPGKAESWRWVENNFNTLSEAELKVLNFNRKHAVTAGYSISFQSPTVRSRGVMSITARAGMSQCEADRIWRDNGREIKVVNDVVHLKLSSMPVSKSNPLTARQREVLEWIAEGKTTQDVATILSLTPVTVEKHLRLAREALNVDTTTQAVAKASAKNQIFLVE